MTAQPEQLPARLQQRAAMQPNRIALHSPQRNWTWAEMMTDVNQLVGQLQALGVRRVGLAGDNSPAWIIGDLACWLAGVVCVPLPAFFSPSQTAHVIEQAGLDGILSSPAQAVSTPLLPEIGFTALTPVKEPVIPAGTVKITFTSGSTGTPKGVCLSGAQLTATTLALQERLHQVRLASHACILPLATLLENIAGVYVPLLMNATVSVLPLAELGFTGSSGLNVAQLVAQLNRLQPNSLILVPQLAQALVTAAEQQQLDTGHFRFLAVGGATVSAALLKRGRAIGLPLYEGYGLSECGSVVALNIPGQEREGSVGRPLAHLQVKVTAQGHIMVRHNTFLGYLGEPARTDEWLDTGDLGQLDAAGFLSVFGRSKNILISSFGRNISPEWLESELIEATGASQVLVFGDGEPQLRALITAPATDSLPQLQQALDGLNSNLPDYARLSMLYVRVQPLSRDEGYITANGRPVRQKILADLETLLANTLTVSASRANTARPIPPSLAKQPARRIQHGIL